MSEKLWLFVAVLFYASIVLGVSINPTVTWTNTLLALAVFCIVDPAVAFFLLLAYASYVELWTQGLSESTRSYLSQSAWLYYHRRRKWTILSMIMIIPASRIVVFGLGFFFAALFSVEDFNLVIGYAFGLCFTIALAYEYCQHLSE